MNNLSNEQKVEKLDKIYKVLIISIAIWILGMEYVNYNRLQTINENQITLQQDVIEIKTKALIALTNQTAINIGVQEQFDKQ